MPRFFGFPPLLLALAWGCLLLPSRSICDEGIHRWMMVLVAFRNAIYEDPLSRLSDWNPSFGTPCSWTGVQCSGPLSSVTSVNLSNSSLRGFLTPQLGSLIWLQELALDNNLLIGSIPYQLSMLANLWMLDLSSNQLSGPIPPVFGNLNKITKIDLHSNNLTGSIPLELGKLPYLVELRLDKNKLSGVIPGTNDSNMQSDGSGLCQLTHLGVGNFSYNYLIGRIPSCLDYLPRSSFQGNCFIVDNSTVQRSAQECTSVNRNDTDKGPAINYSEGLNHKRSSQPLWLVILEITTGAIVLLFIIICTACSKCKRKSSMILWRKIPSLKERTAVSIDCNLLKNVSRISYQEIEASCEDFSNIIGSSLHSVVYKGTMKNGPEIAVISLCISREQWTNSHELSFLAEVADLCRIDHENAAKLLGYCQEHHPFSRMLVFEYASNGTLHKHIHYGDGCQLSWFRRMKIAIGIARGLRYLHTELLPPITIAELSSSAVYLTEDFSPKLVDLERWNKVISKSRVHSGRLMNGDSQICTEDGHQSQFMDVQKNIYAFGVILLELISGRPPYCKEKGILVDWAMKHLEHPDERQQLIDPQVKKVKQEDLAVICSVVSLCLEPEPSKRPSMQIIAAMLEDGIDTTFAAVTWESPLAWAELTLAS